MENIKTNVDLDKLSIEKADRINYATLKLFKSVLMNKDSDRLTVNTGHYIYRGLVFSNELYYGIIGDSTSILHAADKLYGVDLMKSNSTFHKSFGTVNEFSDNTLKIQQILHYVTTYGAEAEGVYNQSLVYVPAEELDLPGDVPVKFTVIHGITLDELISHIDNLLNSGIALSEDVLESIFTLLADLDIEITDIDVIKNKEARVRLYSKYKTAPKSPAEFLRYIIYLVTKSSLLINNKETIDALKDNNAFTTDLLETYIYENSINNLASIFYRYKNLWLAMKNCNNAHIINKMRRLAPAYHKPMEKKILDKITSEAVDVDEVKHELHNVTTFKKVSLFNALSYRLSSPDSIVYKVRNGKSFAKEYHAKHDVDMSVYNTVLESIIDDVKNNIKGKYFVIPNNVTYTVPTSEKMFIGNIPVNSSVSLHNRAVVGVHWENTENARIDLDLHSYNLSDNFGWNASYKQQDKVLFTGDMTDAPKPNGATEAFYISESVNDYALMFKLNDYTCIADKNRPLDYKLIIDAPDVDLLDEDYIINNATVMASIHQKLDCTEETLGLLVADDAANKKFYFMKTSSGGNNSGMVTDKSKQMFSYAMTTAKTALTLNQLIELSGGIIVDSLDNVPTNDEDAKVDYVDLTLENIVKDTIINIIAAGK